MTRFFVVNVSAIALAGAVGYGALHFIQRPDPPRRSAVKPVDIGGPFTLTDHYGRRRTDADFHGRYALLFFGYVHCPDICPTGLHNATMALEKLGDRAAEVVPIFVTVDPERDTPPVLAAYLSNFHPRFVGLTGTGGEVKRAAAAYRVSFGKEDGAREDYLMYHSTSIYLMGKDGSYLTQFRHSETPERMAEIIREHVKR